MQETIRAWRGIGSRMITELQPSEIFVFGSNLDGRHGGGAARQAKEQFGAVDGIGVGLQGQSYAIPTMDGYERMLYYCNQFIDFAKHYPEYTFLLTPIGTGIAGYSIEEIAPIFTALPKNVKKVGWS